jgi:hypothetical protein
MHYDNLSLIYENKLTQSVIREDAINQFIFFVERNNKEKLYFLIENVLNQGEISYLIEQGLLQKGWNAAKKGLATAGIAATMATAGMGGNAQAQQPQQSYNAPIVQQAQNNELLKIINQLPFKYDYDGLQFGSQWNTLNAILPNSFKDASKKFEDAKSNLNQYVPEHLRELEQKKFNKIKQNFDIINKAVQAIKSAKDNNELNKAIQLLPENVQEDVIYKLSNTIEGYKSIIKHKEGMQGFYKQMDNNLDRIK